MLFTWSSKNLCIVFRQWHVTGTFSLILSLIAIVLLTAGYECIRDVSRKYEQSHNARMSAYSTSGSSMFRTYHPPQIWLLHLAETSKVKARSWNHQAHYLS